MSILSRKANLVRHMVDLSTVDCGVDSTKVAKQCRALSGEKDLDDVRQAMIDRYAQVIVSVKDDRTGTNDSALYRASAQLKLDFAASQAILAGQQEIVRLYLYNNIVRQRATLFTEPTQRYEYESPDTGETMGEIRDDGDANICAQRWDTYADGIGSCALYISDSGGELSYSEIPPHRLWYAHAETISDDGADRATNTADLDEATCVVIEMAPTGNERRFCAWYGECDRYENGRQCVYTGKDWREIPDPGTTAIDYSESAKTFVKGATDVANPMVLIARSQGEAGAPVYPIAMLYGDSMQSGLMPVSSSLYDVASELDLMGSMILGAAGRGARGATAFKKGEDTVIPDSFDEGTIFLGRGQELEKFGWPSLHSKDAMEVVNQFARHIAESFSVPGWLVVADHGGDIPSGVALEIMTLPLTRCRSARIALNRHSVRRRFEVERVVINGAIGSPAIPWDERETWYPGERAWPRDPAMRLQEWQTRITMGEADLGDVVQEMRGLRTYEESLNWIEERKELREENKEILSLPAAAPAARASLAERLRGGGGVAAGQQWHREPGPRPEVG